jgi:predicted nicotinamide N-methyase
LDNNKPDHYLSATTRTLQSDHSAMEGSLRRPHTEGFKCSESVEVDGAISSVIFHCNLKNGTNNLEFNCREPSCGALEGEEKAATLTDEDYTVDPKFFDEGYSMAGKTGFKVWTGSRLLIETLAWPQPESDCSRLAEIQNRLAGGARVLELGAGVGVVGTYLAAVGANVLLTDLTTLVENAIDCNLLRNKSITASDTSNDDKCPSWLGPYGCRIGRGWADSTPIDWTCPLDEQLTNVQSESIDFIVASDVVFLVDMLNSLLDTVAALFKASSANNPPFILSFQRRDAKDGEENISFTTVNKVLTAVKERGWTLDCLAWRPVTVSRENKYVIVKEESEVFVFEINPK